MSIGHQSTKPSCTHASASGPAHAYRPSAAAFDMGDTCLATFALHGIIVVNKLVIHLIHLSPLQAMDMISLVQTEGDIPASAYTDPLPDQVEIPELADMHLLLEHHKQLTLQSQAAQRLFTPIVKDQIGRQLRTYI